MIKAASLLQPVILVYHSFLTNMKQHNWNKLHQKKGSSEKNDIYFYPINPKKPFGPLLLMSVLWKTALKSRLILQKRAYGEACVSADRRTRAWWEHKTQTQTNDRQPDPSDNETLMAQLIPTIPCRRPQDQVRQSGFETQCSSTGEDLSRTLICPPVKIAILYCIHCKNKNSKIYGKKRQLEFYRKKYGNNILGFTSLT